MKSICNQITATVAVAAVTSMATLINIPHAEAALFKLSWTGDQGYSATGRFGFDDSLLGTVVTNEQLNSFKISFFNPEGNLLQNFSYNFPNSSSSFNFNFDTVTKTVLQTGSYDTSTGFDLGSNFNTDVAGLFFYTFQDANQGLPTTTIFLKDDLSPEVCSTFPNCRLDNGGQLTATAIPEPGFILGLLTIASLTGYLKKKPACV
ncbi:PEP-CTERM sorting domain-containing protein [Anabaena sp. CCY 0017]|uniref:PEP-CTERM sorting domain-containing protein n=1 Tax=Anabaena sp. CCY 0017 TaxID=3103866 RepID=UPI0039C6CF85